MMKIPKFLEPSPEQKKENARYLKQQLGVPDQLIFSILDILTWLCSGMHCDQFHDAIASDPELMSSYQTVLARYRELESQLVESSGSDEEDDDDV